RHADPGAAAALAAGHAGRGRGRGDRTVTSVQGQHRDVGLPPALPKEGTADGAPGPEATAHRSVRVAWRRRNLLALVGLVVATSFGQAAFVGIAAYATAWLTTAYGASPWLGLVFALALTGITALVI